MQLKINVAEALSELYDPSPAIKTYYGGRGAAKSTAFADALLVQGIERKRRNLCVREVQKSIKQSVYSLLQEQSYTHGMNDFYRFTSDGVFGLNGTEFLFHGLQNHTIDSLKSVTSINRCWAEEAHAITNKSWEVLIPSLFRVPDCQLWISFNTRKVTDPTYIRFVLNADKDMLVKKVSWRDNPWFPEGLNKQRLKLLQDDPEACAHVWEGEPDTRHNGSVFARWVDKAFNSGRVKDGLYDPDLAVMTAWDLGWSDSTSIIFYQQAGKETRIIDCYESFNEDIPHYVNVIKERPYKYGRHFVTHDAGNKLLAAGGKSVAEIAQACGLQMTIIPETTHLNRIEAARRLLGGCWLDKTLCRDLINALMHYQFKHNDELNIFSNEPVHDWSSHYSTAFELLARVVRDEAPEKKIDNRGIFTYKGTQDGKIIGQIDLKAYFKKKARERNE